MKRTQRVAVTALVVLLSLSMAACTPHARQPTGSATVIRTESVADYPELTLEAGKRLDRDLIADIDVSAFTGDEWRPEEVSGPAGAELTMLTHVPSGCAVTTVRGDTGSLGIDAADDEAASRSVLEAFVGQLENEPPTLDLPGAGIAESVTFAAVTVPSGNQVMLARGLAAIEQYLVLIVQCPAGTDVVAFADVFVLTALAIRIARS